MSKVVYAWCENNNPFYIGIGDSCRADSCNSRNPHTLYKRKKCEREGTFSLQILHTDLIWEQACEIECQLIEQYGRRDLGTGCLTNMTNGGEGAVGRKMSEKNKRLLSETRKGKNNPYAGYKGKNHHSARAVNTDVGCFDTVTDAANALKTSTRTIYNRCENKNFPDYYLM